MRELTTREKVVARARELWARKEIRILVAALLALAVLLVVVLVRGGDDDADDAPRRRHRVVGDQTPPLQLREVWATDSAPCRHRPPQPAAEDPATLCGPDAEGDTVRYRLAPAVVSGGVESAEVVPAPAGRGRAVTITLGPDALAALRPVTEELHGTGGQVALVLGTQILTAPEVRLAEVAGPLMLVGPYHREDAEALAARILAGG